MMNCRDALLPEECVFVSHPILAIRVILSLSSAAVAYQNDDRSADLWRSDISLK
jgi:hypothetical protein